MSQVRVDDIVNQAGTGAPSHSQGLTTTTLTASSTTTLSGLSTGVVHANSSGVLSSSTIVNADVSASAAIAGTKIDPNFGTQAITTSGQVNYTLTANSDTHDVRWAQTAHTNSFAAIRVTDTADFRQMMGFLINTDQADTAPETVLELGPSHQMKLGGPANVNTFEILDSRNLTDSSIVLSKTNTSTTQDYMAFYKDGDRTTLVGTLSDTAGVFGAVDASDVRLKQDVTDYSGGLDVIKALRPVNFRWISDPAELCIGFIAQEVQTVLPSAVKTHTDEMQTLMISRAVLFPYLVSAIKELTARVEALEAV